MEILFTIRFLGKIILKMDGSLLRRMNLKKNDCFVVSVPFSDSGSIHPQTEEILKKCDELKIPVLIDSAYYSISGGLKIIDSLTTASLGNAIPFGDLMTGRYALSATGNQTRAVFVGGTDGTTQCFDFFFLKHKNRRMRCFRGDFVYHKISWQNYFKDGWKFIEEDELKKK